LNTPDINFDEYYIEAEQMMAGEKVKFAKSFKKEVAEHLSRGDAVWGDELPWSKVSDIIRIGQGQLTVWAAGTGAGKSIIVGQAILGLLHDRRALIASFEMMPHETLSRMCRQASGGFPPETWTDDFLEHIDKQLIVYADRGVVSPNTVLGVLHWAFRAADVDHFVIDSLVKCGFSKEDHSSQAKFVDHLQVIAKHYGKHIHLICHTRKSNGEKDNRDSIRGAGEIVDLCDNCIIINRNRDKESAADRFKLGVASDRDMQVMEQPDTYLMVDKNRHFSTERSFGLWFDEPSQQFRSSEGAPAIQVQCTHDAQIFRGAA
jgi:twinkle protein